MLAIAVALNSTMPADNLVLTETFTHFRPGEGYHGVHTGLKGWLEMEMEDFWHYNPKESGQFDKEATLAFVSRLSNDEVMSLLRAMGRPLATMSSAKSGMYSSMPCLLSDLKTWLA